MSYQREEMPDDLCVGDVDPASELAHVYLGGVVELPEKSRKSEGETGNRKKRTNDESNEKIRKNAACVYNETDWGAVGM